MNFRLSLIDFLKTKGFDLLIIAPDDHNFHKIKALGYPCIPIKKLERKGKNPFKELALTKELRTIYKSEGIDLAIHFTIKPNIYGSLAAARAGIPSISTVTGLGYTFLSNGLASKLAKLLYKRAFKKTTKIIFQNNDDKQLFEQLKLAAKNKTLVIPGSGIDTTNFSLPQRKEPETFNLLFVGRLLYDKGIVELLEAFTRMDADKYPAKLHIIGEIDSRNPSALNEEHINKYASNPNITFHGHINGIKPHYENISAVVLPSYREGLPKVLLEASSMGIPIITTDTAGCRDVVTDGKNGFIVPVKDITLLKDAIEKMIKLSPEERLEMGKMGRKLAVEKFDTSIVNQSYYNIISELLETHV